ncbi:MAG: agmatine deiminase family protein [Terricaulis sp.]|nr:agmatine deiminase family protein [Terricaulis sp.]
MSTTRIPPEWAPHKAIWTAWPREPAYWGDAFDTARIEVAAMIRALHEGGERVRVLVDGREGEASAKLALAGAGELIQGRYGDIWLRDIGPIFDDQGRAHAFGYNGWGGKFVMAGDEAVAAQVAEHAGAELVRHDFILEGGGVEMDGEGALLTTRQCVLNPNRNSHWTEAAAEVELKRAFGVEKILWLDEGMLNDHTDGHIDNLARFVGPGRVVCQAPYGKDDPNVDVLREIALTLRGMTDARGRKLEVIEIPSPGLIVDDEGEAVPASHMNFLIGNGVVLVPIYSDSGDDALRALAPLFPDRKVLGLSSHAILAGGGSFHCITQQEPA